MSDDLVKRYRALQDHIGGCHDGYCVIKKPSGMHTNGGCNCLMDLKLHKASRVGQLLRCAQQMADRIEALEAENRELALKLLAAHAQAAGAHEAQLAAEAKLEQALRTLEEYACSCTDQCSDMQLSCGDAASDTIEKLKGGE